jgi:hypothetical protein
MYRRELLTATATTVTASTIAGCLGSRENDSGRLDLTVRNDGNEAVDIDVVVRGDDGTLYAEETERIDPGVARTIETTVGATGRPEVVVTGGDWEGRLAWDAAVCALYDGTVAVDAGAVSTAGECVDTR